ATEARNTFANYSPQ
ncbi:unnamed protein product, partial [Oikopleura dioica]